MYNCFKDVGMAMAQVFVQVWDDVASTSISNCAIPSVMP